VLINLVVNAVDAMSAGGSLIVETASVRLDDAYCDNHAEIEPGLYCMLAVTDTGKGMAPETAEKIFEPFFTTKNNGGSGLGLATVHGIVRQHGGHINVYSEPEKGTCFKIYLPRSPQPSEAEPQAGEESTSLVGGDETILLVEDDTMVRGLAKAALDQLGYTVLPAHDAESAIHIADQHDNDIDLLLTDVVLPGLNGAELHGNLCLARPHLPALFMSGYTGNVVQDHGVIGEGMRFIPKPFTLTELASSVRNALETARSG
jgi:CheY-like chemotaxis protein